MSAREVAIVSYASLLAVPGEPPRDEVELLLPVVTEAIARSGIPKRELGFTVSGSCDYLGGRPFSFVMALDAIGAWPPIAESHVEMDGAFALYEAWVRLQCGDVDSALVYAFGRSTQGDLGRVLAQQLDPYTLSPLWPDDTALAALQARALLDGGRVSERDFAAVAARSRGGDAEDLMKRPYTVAPLRAHDRGTVADGAAAIVLAVGDLARKVCKRPAWIRGIDHRIEQHQLGQRDLAHSASTRLAGERAGVGKGPVDVAELYAPYTHQELILREALGLGEGVDVTPSGGALAAHPLMVAGLSRFGEAAERIIDGSASRAVAHATSGPCLQQNLVAVLEAAP